MTSRDPYGIGATERHIFVPAIMGAGLLFSIATVIRDVLRSRQGRVFGLDRRLDITGRASAHHVLTGEPPEAGLHSAVRPRLFYLLTGATALGVATYIGIGATANYFRSYGYVPGIAWLWMVSLLLTVTLARIGWVSLRIYRTWPVPAAGAYRLIVNTPLGRASAAAGETEVPRLLLGWAAWAAAIASGILVLMVIEPPWFVTAVNSAVTSTVASWNWLAVLPLDLVGKTVPALLLAVVIGVATLRCPVFAVAYITAMVGGWLSYVLLKALVEQPRPAIAGWVGLDSFPSGHLVQATVIAGLLPVALTVLTRRRWPAQVVAPLLALLLVATALYRVHLGTHWLTDVVGGFLIGATFVLLAHWALRHPRWHSRCHGCPWVVAAVGAQPERPGLFGVPAGVASMARWTTRGWTLAVIVSFALLAFLVGVPRDPEGDGMLAPLEQPIQLGLLTLAVVGWLLAWRYEAAAAVLLALAGLGLGTLSALSYPPYVSVLVLGAFLAPAVVWWVLWQHTRGVRAIALLAVVTAALVVAGWTGASAAYHHYFGPAHPESATVALPVDRVDWVWVGAVTESSFRVRARIDDHDAEQAVLLVERPDGPTAYESDPVSVPDSGVIGWTATGLLPDTVYEYVVVVDDQVDQSRGHGAVRTFPDGPASFTVAVGACARTASNGAVFDAIRDVEPILYLAVGDIHYGNIAVDDVDAFRARYNDVAGAPAQSALYRAVPIAYVWDDHDYGPNDSDARSPARTAARLAYRENVPHYPLVAGPGDAAIHQAFSVGRVRFILTDVRSERTDHTMLGDAQLRWLERELVEASRDHALVVWVNPVPWIAPDGSSSDNWAGYPAERSHLAETIEEAGIDNLVMLSGDAHMLAIDDGGNSGYGPSGRGFPVLHAAALDRPGSLKGGPYSHGALPGAGQFGTLTVSDDGTGPVTVQLAGYDWTGQRLLSYSFTVPSEPATGST